MCSLLALLKSDEYSFLGGRGWLINGKWKKYSPSCCRRWRRDPHLREGTCIAIISMWIPMGLEKKHPPVLVKHRDVLATRWLSLGSLISKMFPGSGNLFSVLCLQHSWFCFCLFSLVVMDLMFPSNLFCSNKITVDVDCRHEIKKSLAPWKKSYYKPKQYVKKQRHHFANKGLSSQSYGFSTRHVWMWELDHKEGWVLKNWCFWIVVWRRLLRIPWTAWWSSQSILKEINPEHSLEGLMMKLKLQYFGHLMQRTHSLEKTLMLGKIEGRRRRGQQRIKWLDGITGSMDMSLSELREIVKDRETWRAIVHGVPKSWTWLNDWTTTVKC